MNPSAYSIDESQQKVDHTSHHLPPPPSAPPVEPSPSVPPPLPPPPAMHRNITFQGATTNTPTNPPGIQPTPPAVLQDYIPHSPVPWSTGLCDCFNDFSSCCLTFWCPCITFGRIAEIVDRGALSCAISGGLYTLLVCVTGCGCLYSCIYRAKMRGQFALEESPCADCCVHWCCEPCALCQEYRELQNHGFDMSIGWQGNMDRQRRLATMAPAVEGGMTR
ncbi:hypothetical protein Tsubulata_018576 [Turnera subulata]|uniref:Uncharacterized protein n=1 Tax=Turnera subulata TaxID=218843 RepID=A0A9Q0JIR7_9ROSI|nr:hypothetical protein Tsubulata_018576 [Turnera subulata]